jgi:cysteinyl-tRNA synthetase
LGLEVTRPEIKVEPPEDSAQSAIETLIAQRVEARRAKNFVESDRLRDELVAQGITLIDQPDGTTKWYKA